MANKVWLVTRGDGMTRCRAGDKRGGRTGETDGVQHRRSASVTTPATPFQPLRQTISHFTPDTALSLQLQPRAANSPHSVLRKSLRFHASGTSPTRGLHTAATEIAPDTCSKPRATYRQRLRSRRSLILPPTPYQFDRLSPAAAPTSWREEATWRQQTSPPLLKVRPHLPLSRTHHALSTESHFPFDGSPLPHFRS